MSFPGGKTARLGDLVYTILRARVDANAGSQLRLRLTVRHRTGDSPNYFGSNAYRLLVNGVPRAPDKWPSDVVEARSAKEGEVEFVFPQNPRSLVLLVGTDETVRLPITLKPAQQ